MIREPHVLVAGAVLGQPIGGVRRHNAELLPRAARLLAESGGTLTVLEGTTPLPEEWRESVERVSSRVPYQPPWKRWVAERHAIATAVRDAQRSGRPFDLLHTGHVPVPEIPLPYSVTIHDLRDLELARGPTLRQLVSPRVLAHAFRHARTVITVSQTVASAIEERFPTRRIVIVPNAADHLEVLPRATGPGPLLHIGHVERRKNLELLLEALAVDPGLPDLLLAGAPKAAEDLRLLRRARELGVANRVALLGTVTDRQLAELLAEAACVVIPSSLEGFGIGVLEAQRARVPLAVSRAGALPEVAGTEVPSFAPDDPAEAAHAIRAALDTRETELDRLAAQAARFSWDASARELVDAWREAVAAGA